MTDEDPLEWTEDGLPRSRRFGDVYFSAEDGLAETRAVFLEGCGLPDAWRGRRRFVVGELGFGTGLNVSALLDLWRRARPRGGRLHIFSVEAFPVTSADAARALSRWPELAPVAGPLLDRWPARARGVHRVDLPELGAILDLAVMDVADALSGWRGAADAWFLDGFAPAQNPRMWTDEVLALVAARSAPGARAATFTVAGAVRRGLAAAGFSVGKRPGFGRKRERLEARFAGVPEDAGPRRIVIVGGGIAGASAVRAARALGVEALVVDAGAPGAGSGNPAALVTPRLDAGLGPPAALYAQAFRRAVRLYEAMPDVLIARGVLQLAQQPRDAARFAKLAASDLFEGSELAVLDPHAASARLGEAAPMALDQASALVVEPAAVLAAWRPEILAGAVSRLEATDGEWHVLDAHGAEILRADVVVVAAALGSRTLIPRLPLEPVRGQASWIDDVPPAGTAAAWGGYVAPTRAGVLFGATHDRGDEELDIRPGDHVRNLELLARGAPELASRVAGRRPEGRAAIRAVTPDRLPIAGAMGPAGLFALTGFGSRGFAFAPLLAEHVAALALGAPSPLLAPQAGLVAPDRFSRSLHS